MDGEVGEVIAGLCLIPMRFDEIGDGDISRIHEMLIWEKVLLCQIGMDCGKNSLIDFYR
jgi:hypothetical protein